MKNIIIALGLIFGFTTLIQAQGYKKFYNPEGFRVPIGLLATNDANIGFFLKSHQGEIRVEIVSVDSTGEEHIIHSIQHDSMNSIAKRTAQANHATFGHTENEMVFVAQLSSPLEINVHSYDHNSLDLKSFRFIAPITLVNIRVFNIVKVSNGYLITGDCVIPGEHQRGYFLSLDKDFNVKYWKFYSTPYPDIEIYGVIEEEGFYLLYGYISIFNNVRGWIKMEVDKDTGERLSYEVFTTKPHSYRLYPVDHDSAKFVGIATYANLEKTELTPSWVLLDENFDVLKQTEFGIRFYELQRLTGYLEYPYHSCRDFEGNFIIATQQFLPFNLQNFPPDSVTEVLCLTKINPLGEILWETRDSVVYYEDSKEWTVGGISGISTGPMGEIYVLGRVNDWDTIRNQYKTFGYIFKYDKNGCMIENCRTSNVSNDEVDNQMSVFPNPVFDILHINSDNFSESTHGYTIYYFQGRLIERNSQLKESIDVSHYIPGIYILSVYDNYGRRYNKKFVKL